MLMPAIPIDEAELYERAAAAVAVDSPKNEIGPITRIHGWELEHHLLGDQDESLGR